MKKIVDFIHVHKSAAGLQIAHAGRKASTAPPFFVNARDAVPVKDVCLCVHIFCCAHLVSIIGWMG
jgi:2,4-dienoyl-CoA reductase-like NADH-dependent reductase (Old Yellow Enzyme family)